MRIVVAALLATLLAPACLSFQEGPLETDRPASEFLLLRGGYGGVCCLSMRKTRTSTSLDIYLNLRLESCGNR